MLVLSRKPTESIVIGDTVTLTILSCEGNRVRIGITAPDDVHILRGEIAAHRATFADAAQGGQAPRRDLVEVS